MEREVCLELQGIGVSFEGVRANDDINLKVYAQDRLAILGPNGAGKTTLFNVICGEFPPTDGKILLYGKDITQEPNYKRVASGLSRTFQITALFWNQSILENIILALLGVDSKHKFSFFRSLGQYSQLFDEAIKLIEMVRLTEKKDMLIKNLSYGDQRLVELLMCLASNPKIICLDEPNAGLSVSESKTMINVIKSLPKDITILLIEHDMDLVFEIVDRIMVLHDGKVVATGNTENIRNDRRVQQIYLGIEEEGV